MEGVSADVESQNSQTVTWKFCGKTYPKNELVFFTQILLLYIVVLTSLANLTRDVSHRDLWITLLSSCIGYILPHPSIKKNKYDRG